jgi:nicotinamidase-related amidase
MPSLTLSPSSTALVLIDLQQGIVGRTLAPHSAADVQRNARRLAEALRPAGALIVYVRVAIGSLPVLSVDSPASPPGSPPPPASASELSPDSGFQPGDLLITKRQWGAFYGTDLDLQLRRRHIRTIVLGGIATNYGVESTARAASELAFEQIFVEDAMSTLSAEAHAFSINLVLKRIGRVRSTDEVLAALAP